MHSFVLYSYLIKFLYLPIKSLYLLLLLLLTLLFELHVNKPTKSYKVIILYLLTAQNIQRSSPIYSTLLILLHEVQETHSSHTASETPLSFLNLVTVPVSGQKILLKSCLASCHHKICSSVQPEIISTTPATLSNEPFQFHIPSRLFN